jgi:hypothetical protein
MKRWDGERRRQMKRERKRDEEMKGSKMKR